MFKNSKSIYLSAIAGVILLLFLGVYRPITAQAPIDASIFSGGTEIQSDPRVSSQQVNIINGIFNRYNEIDGAELVYVVPQPVVRGSRVDDPEAEADEKPQHEVYLSGFWIYRHEVTNKMYAECVDAGACTEPETAADGPLSHYGELVYMNHPVLGVDWNQAQAYCQYAGGRLPTEAEWEKAARGENGLTYPWGDEEPNCELANYEGCLDDPNGPTSDAYARNDDYFAGASPFGVYHMAGNVSEWVYDWYDEDYYTNPDQFIYANPPGPQNGRMKVVKGGNFQDDPQALRAAARSGSNPNDSLDAGGFRCVGLGTQKQKPDGDQGDEITTTRRCPPDFPPFCLSEDGDEPFQPGSPEFGSSTTADGEASSTSLDREEISWNFNCSGQNLDEVIINLGQPATGNETVTIGGYEYSCDTNANYPNRLFCSGPALVQGQTVAITICTADGQEASSTTTVGENGELDGGDGENYRCPEGYEFSEESEDCVPPENGGEENGGDGGFCPGSCPDEYAALEGGQCQPSREDECDYGFHYDEFYQTCMPSTNTSEDCRCGEFYNAELGCCASLTGCYGNGEDGQNGQDGENGEFDGNGDEFGCPEETYLNEFGNCAPISTTEGECPQGYEYSELEGCTSTETGCPVGTYYDAEIEDCRSTTGEGSECPEGYYYDTRSNCCKRNDGGGRLGCPVGYYYEEGLGYCSPPPDDGECPEGYAYNVEFQRCMADGENGGPECPTGQAYNVELGYCAPPPGEGGECREGFYYDSTVELCVSNSDDDPGTYTGCPAGYAYDEIEQGCTTTGEPGGGGCLTFSWNLGYCATPTVPSCPIGEVWDYGEQACVERFSYTDTPEPEEPPEDEFQDDEF
jgi:formylglycine-generating enzyme required for sulfatase activity